MPCSARGPCPHDTAVLPSAVCGAHAFAAACLHTARCGCVSHTRSRPPCPLPPLCNGCVPSGGCLCTQRPSVCTLLPHQHTCLPATCCRPAGLQLTGPMLLFLMSHSPPSQGPRATALLALQMERKGAAEHVPHLYMECATWGWYWVSGDSTNHAAQAAAQQQHMHVLVGSCRGSGPETAWMRLAWRIGGGMWEARCCAVVSLAVWQ